jgi:hypothetical protein
MATFERGDVNILTLKRNVEGTEKILKFYISKTSYITVISWPDDELSASDRAKIDGPTSSDGNVYWIHITPSFAYDLAENPQPSERIWLASFEEAQEIASLVET